MKLTEGTRRALAYRRFARTATADGFLRVSENGAPLWKLRRGAWYRNRITDVRIDPEGQELWIKIDLTKREAEAYANETYHDDRVRNVERRRARRGLDISQAGYTDKRASQGGYEDIDVVHKRDGSYITRRITRAVRPSARNLDGR